MGAALVKSMHVQHAPTLDVDTSDQNRSCDFVVEHYYNSAPVLIKHNPDPRQPVFIRVDPNVTRNLSNKEQKEITHGIQYPTYVSVDISGSVEIRFAKTDVTIRLEGFEIVAAISSSALDYEHIRHIPDPPYCISTMSRFIEIGWILPEPPGIAKKVEVQFNIQSSPHKAHVAQIGKWQHAVIKKYEYPAFSSYRMEELSPGMEVVFRLSYTNVYGKSVFSSPSAVMNTLATPPAAPESLECASLLYNCVLLRWSPGVDNGSPVTCFSLRGKSIGGDFTDLYSGPKREFLVLYLYPEFSYSFEVCAENAFGVSGYSRMLSILTPKLYRRMENSPLSAVDSTILSEVDRLSVERSDVWLECYDEQSRREFYFNRLTGLRQLDIPPVLYRRRNSIVGLDEEDQRIDSARKEKETFRNKRYGLMQSLGRGSSSPSRRDKEYLFVNINRTDLLWDGYTALMEATVDSLKKLLKVNFLNEKGIDSGGLVKDFYLHLSRHSLIYAGSYLRRLLAFDSAGGAYFSATYVDGDTPAPGTEKELRRLVESIGKTSVAKLDIIAVADYAGYLGRMLGKALFDEQLLEFPLSVILTKLILDAEVSIDDLKLIDTALYKSLNWILDHDITDVIEETFTILDAKTKQEVALCENGANREVTNENKAEYVALRIAWHVKFQLQPILDAFLKEFWSIVPLRALRENNITPSDLANMMQGLQSTNVDQIRAYCVFQGGKNFDDQHESVMTLWRILGGFSDGHKALFLKFVTGTARVPLDGFNPPFNITQGSDMAVDSLPRSHTCFNQLVLPPYSSADVFREKLTFAIENCDGFELS